MLFDLLRDIFKARGRDRSAKPETAPDVITEYENLARTGRLVLFDYAYRPCARQWHGSPGLRRLARLFKAGEKCYSELLQEFATLAPSLSEIALARVEGSFAPCWDNGWIPALDAVSLCGFLKKYRPRIYLEIGSGNSTKFARWAIDHFELDTRLVSIDPEPRVEVDALCDEVIRTRCEDAPATVFAQLKPSDLLFVDNSHRAFPGSDVTVFFTEILPALAPGVVYGIHDIFLPDDYPEDWAPRMYNEQYLLTAYLLGGANGDEILLPNAWVTRNPGLLGMLDPLWSNPKLAGIQSSGAIFWMRAGGQANPFTPESA